MVINPTLWRIDLLGDLSVSREDRSIRHFQTQKTKALLAYLALYIQRQHSREELVDLLWPDAEMDAGRHRLSQALTWLRSQFRDPGSSQPDGQSGPYDVLWSDRNTVGLNPAMVRTDIGEFEAALVAADKGDDPLARAEALRSAINLYRGDLLSGQYEDWVLLERQRLLTAFLFALRRLAAHHELTQEWDLALGCMRRAVAADPLAEEAHCDIIRLLAATGQTAAAVRQYREMEHLLATQLETQPSSAARSLIERIRDSNRGPAAPPEAQHRSIPPPLPSLPTRFFGREEELERVQMLAEPGAARLVTLIGTGGSGKTRLALEAASRLARSYEGAVWFVPLADVADIRMLPTALVEAMRLPYSGSEPLDAVIEALAPCPSLLVLDNLEHLARGMNRLLQELMARLPALTVLGTSRQRLSLDGERDVAVPPLPLPVVDGGSPTTALLMSCASVQLFVDRAQAVQPAFRITPRNAGDIARLCARLEGLPLAIELCAAWAPMLTPQQMLARLTRRLELLVSRRADITPRHRTLRAAIEYSYAHLTPEQQRFFVRLSVFQGGWNLDAAEAVGAAASPVSDASALEALTELRERSLVLSEEADSEMRFRMLDTLREFASEQMSPDDAALWRRSHAEYFVDLVRDAEPHLLGPQQGAWLSRIETEHDNIRAALTWALEHKEAETGLRLAGALSVFWDMRGYLTEGEEWLDRLLALPGTVPGPIRAKALTARGYLARHQGDSTAVNDAMDEAMSLWRSLEDAHGLANCLQVQATIAYSREHCDTAQALLEEGLDIARRLGDRLLIAGALHNLGNLVLEQGDLVQAWQRYTESLGQYRASGITNRVAYALNNMGLVARYQGDLDAARSLLKESLAVSRQLADRPGMAETLLNLGTVSRLSREPADALSLLGESATLANEIGERRLLAWCAKEMGHLACAQLWHALGVRLLSAAEALRSSMGISFKPAGPQEIAEDLAKARRVLGETGFAAAWAAGNGLSPTEVYGEVLWMSRRLDKVEAAAPVSQMIGEHAGWSAR